MASDVFEQYPDYLEEIDFIKKFKEAQRVLEANYNFNVRMILLGATKRTGNDIYWRTLPALAMIIENFTSVERLHRRNLIATLENLKEYTDCWIPSDSYILVYERETKTIVVKYIKKLSLKVDHNKVRAILPCNLLMRVEEFASE